MLVTTKELLCVANAENKAIGAFNITGLETLQAVLQAAESRKEPVILQFAQVHEEEQIISLNIIGPIMVMMADQATIPVAVHLDHGVDLHILKKALDMGFTSIMFDGSSLPYGENIAYTRMAVSMAQEYGASVEAEIGQMAGITLNDRKITENRKVDRRMFTDPLIAQDFVEKTDVDCLACAFGTVHGLYTTKPCLDYDLVKELDAAIGVPIVMHGGSGVSEADYDIVIENGVRKVNYYTYMAKSGGKQREHMHLLLILFTSMI
ncbi:MAG: class II fructose-bisphosphate aldolase [[Clostridium] innocuum]